MYETDCLIGNNLDCKYGLPTYLAAFQYYLMYVWVDELIHYAFYYYTDNIKTYYSTEKNNNNTHYYLVGPLVYLQSVWV